MVLFVGTTWPFNLGMLCCYGLLEKPFQVELIWGRGYEGSVIPPIQKLEFSITNQGLKVVWSKMLNLIWSQNMFSVMNLAQLTHWLSLPTLCFASCICTLWAM